MRDAELRPAVAALGSGGVVAVATETFYGLLADATSPRAIEAVFALKGRPADKGVALLLPDPGAWDELVIEVPLLARRLAARFWPGPLTIVLGARPTLDPRLTFAGGVGVRWPGASDAARIVAAFGRPVTATSANLAGHAACATAEEVRRELGGALTIVSGAAPGGEPSTVVRVAGDDVRVLRRGRVGESALREAVGTVAFPPV